MKSKYRGRIAPTPTGYLHLGHARTFWIASLRAREAGGELIYRCLGCGKQYGIEKLLYTCPDCKQVLLIEDLKFESLKKILQVMERSLPFLGEGLLNKDRAQHPSIINELFNFWEPEVFKLVRSLLRTSSK